MHTELKNEILGLPHLLIVENAAGLHVIDYPDMEEAIYEAVHLAAQNGFEGHALVVLPLVNYTADAIQQADLSESAMLALEDGPWALIVDDSTVRRCLHFAPGQRANAESEARRIATESLIPIGVTLAARVARFRPIRIQQGATDPEMAITIGHVATQWSGPATNGHFR